MGSICNSRLGNFSRTNIKLYPLYGTIGGSLNILVGNNPSFLEDLEGHFVRVEPLEVILCLHGFRCYPPVICSA